MADMLPSLARPYNFITAPDDVGVDPGRVVVIAYEEMLRVQAADGDAEAEERLHNPATIPPALEMGAFVIVEDTVQAAHWFGQVVQPQLNMALFSGGRFNPGTATALKRVLEGGVQSSVFLRQSYHYEIILIGQVQPGGNVLGSIKTRPRAGCKGRPARPDEVIRYLGLPATIDGNRNVLGRFADAEIPVTIDMQALAMHLLIVGATGSGKTNSVANTIASAQAMGACVLVLDMKPDFQDVDAANGDLPGEAWAPQASLGLGPRALKDVHYFGLAGQDRRDKSERQLSVWCSDVDREMLAAAIFPSTSEHNQRDLLLTVLENFAAKQKPEARWSLRMVLEWLQNESAAGAGGNGSNGDGEGKSSSGLAKRAASILGVEINKASFDAMLRKLKMRQIRWLDAGDKARQMDGASEALWGAVPAVSQRNIVDFDGQRDLQAGHVVVIRQPAEGREYGLFLSYLLRRLVRDLAMRRLQFPIVVVVDEAHEIFAGEKAVAEAATVSVQRAVLKGRSLGLGFVFSSQNPSQIPPTIRNNLNSKIVHRLNASDELRLALPDAPDELRQACMSLGVGEALVAIQGCRATVRATMAPSPFKLTRLVGAGARRFLADALEASGEAEAA